MKKVLILLLLLNSFVACRKNDALQPERISITMLAPSVSGNLVLLYSDDQYLITTHFDQFIAWPGFMNSHYATLKEKALADAVGNDTLSMADYLRFKPDGDYILAYCLENRVAEIRKKKTNQLIKTIEMEHYRVGGPMTMHGGRRFYIGKTLILETVDMIS